MNLYIHIPFCFSKCPYCPFFSCTNSESIYEEYFQTLSKEIDIKSQLFKSKAITTIYIGGGTPNLIPYRYIVDTISQIKKKFDTTNDIEVTMEMYPEYITKGNLQAYKKAGVNRVSIGVQTTQDDHLKELNRRYTYEEFLEKYKVVKEIGFKNIGIDLIFGYPNHTLKQWKESLEKISSLDIQHISCYSLEIEENTPYGKLSQEGKLPIPSEIVDRQMYHYACRYLKTKGFNQYEISNWSKEGYECRHNLDFWKYSDYIGLGAGAYSRISGVKSNNPEDIHKYISNVWDINKEYIDEETKEKERIMLGLRMTQGIPYNKELFQKEYMKKGNGYMFLNTKGKDLYNTVVAKYLNS